MPTDSFPPNTAKAGKFHKTTWVASGGLPDIDFHEIMFLIAPRAFLDVSGLNDGEKLT